MKESMNQKKERVWQPERTARLLVAGWQLRYYRVLLKHTGLAIKKPKEEPAL
jgi:hypothetical protein